LLLPAAAVAGLLEAGRRKAAALALATYLAGPAAAGWAWVAGQIDGLFAPVQRIDPPMLEAYLQILDRIPPRSQVAAMWQLDLWLLPLAKTHRPDLEIRGGGAYGNPPSTTYTRPPTHGSGT